VKFCLNKGEPSSKPKYLYKFDSEQVLWRKGLKLKLFLFEIECLQAIEAKISNYVLLA